MILFVVSYLGGVLTILSPCILPVLPFVFARADQPHQERPAAIARHGLHAYRFHARDLHLVLGPAGDGKPVRFRVLIDGKTPEGDHGVDTDVQGNGVVSEQRLYQLVRQDKSIADREFEIEFVDPGAQAFAFTFG